MKKLQDALKSSDEVGNREANYIQFLSFSIDPERDSVPELKKWADRFQINPQNWWLLTGNKKEIYDLSIKDMRLGLVDGKNVDTNFYHTDYFVLLDKDHVIRSRRDEQGNPTFYHGLDSNDIKNLASDIVLLNLEKDPKKPFFLSGKLELILIVFVLLAVGMVALFTWMKKENKRV
jgi:protein SCO1/2